MLKLTDPLLTRAESKAISVFRLREQRALGPWNWRAESSLVNWIALLFLRTALLLAH